MARKPNAAADLQLAAAVLEPVQLYDDISTALNQPSFLDSLASTRKGRESVLKILEAARNVLVTEGYGQLTLRLVAERAGTAHASLQHHFPTKEKLLHALMRYQGEIYRQDVRKIFLDAEADPAERFRTYMRYIIRDLQLSSVQTMFYEMRAMARHNDFIASAVGNMYVLYRRRIDLMLGVINPDMPAETRAVRAALIISLIDGLIPFVGDETRTDPEIERITAAAEQQIMAIATSP